MNAERTKMLEQLRALLERLPDNETPILATIITIRGHEDIVCYWGRSPHTRNNEQLERACATVLINEATRRGGEVRELECSGPRPVDTTPTNSSPPPKDEKPS